MANTMTSVTELIAEGYADFPVDVIVREKTGKLLAVHEYLDWHTAVECATSAFEAGFRVDIEESDGQAAYN